MQSVPFENVKNVYTFRFVAFPPCAGAMLNSSFSIPILTGDPRLEPNHCSNRNFAVLRIGYHSGCKIACFVRISSTGRRKALYVLQAMRMSCTKQTGNLQGHRRETCGALAIDHSRICPSWKQNKQNRALLVAVGHIPE